MSTNNHSPKPTSPFVQAKERLDDVVMETLISKDDPKDDPKDVAEKNAEAVAVDQPNSKPATASVLAREDFNDVTIEDASMKGESNKGQICEAVLYCRKDLKAHLPSPQTSPPGWQAHCVRRERSEYSCIAPWRPASLLGGLPCRVA